MQKLRAVLIVVLLLFLVMVSTSGNFLVIERPQQADVIVVLAGETDRRPARALDLLRRSYAPKLLLDVPAAARIYDQEQLTIAQAYVDRLPDRQKIAICPIAGLSTKAEAAAVSHCLDKMPSHRILVVTSDYHTRRALSIFRYELPGREVTVTAATNPEQFGTSWWKNRQWAKINLDEWLRLVWWELVDRWR